MLTGDGAADAKLLSAAHIALATPEVRNSDAEVLDLADFARPAERLFMPCVGNLLMTLSLQLALRRGCCCTL